MDYHLLSDTISLGLPIVYFKGSRVEFSKLSGISVPEGCFNLGKLCRLWVFTVCLSTCLVNKGASQPQHANQEAMAPQPLG